MRKVSYIVVAFGVVLLVAIISTPEIAAPLIYAQGDGLAPAGTPRETYYAPFPLPVVLDGDLSEWADVPKVTLPETTFPAAASVTFAGAADAANLYFMADIVDANIISGTHGEDYWNEDSVEFYINASGDLTLTEYEDSVAQVTVPALNKDRSADDVVFSGVHGTTVNAQVAVVASEAGWVVELALPLVNDVWKITLEHGGQLGFQVHLNGASELSRDTKLIWSRFDTVDQSYQNPSVFGTLIFYEIGQSGIPATPTPEPDPTVIQVSADAVYQNPALPVAERVEDLLARMTLDEKIGQMTLVENNSIGAADVKRTLIGGVLSGGGGSPRENSAMAWAAMVDAYQSAAMGTRLGIPMIYGVDAVHGHNNLYGATIFPHNIGLGAANDPDLMERIGQATALEMAATGIFWDYAPAVTVPQDIRWGRTYEGYGEDPALVSMLATAYLRGLQGDDLSDPLTVLATPKHYLGDGGTAWGTGTVGDNLLDRGDTQIDEETLRALYLPPYAAVIEAGAQSIMVSFSSWNGANLHGNAYLVTDVLKGELGFDGFVVSDWGGVDYVASEYYDAVVRSINAGVDMNMVPQDYQRFITTLTDAVENGDVPLERIDDAVRRILKVKFELGLFEHPYSDPALLDQVGAQAHRDLARAAVAESAVLLKNAGDVLPLDPANDLILVAGSAADDLGVQMGGWSISWQGSSGVTTIGTTILGGILNTVTNPDRVLYNARGRFSNLDDDLIVETCIAVVGEQPYAEWHGDDPLLEIPSADLTVISGFQERCNTVIVVLVSGRPLIVTDEIDGWDALVAVWLPGTEGQGVADVLFGVEPFSGKLSFTWPRAVDQLPLGSSDGEPLFPFGYGLETAP